MTPSNWVNGYTHDELDNVYTEIVHYLKQETLSQLLEMHNNSLDFNSQKV